MKSIAALASLLCYATGGTALATSLKGEPIPERPPAKAIWQLDSLDGLEILGINEDGADPVFVQRQVGHRYQSTTAIYSGVSGDFMNTMMRRHLDRALEMEEAPR